MDIHGGGGGQKYGITLAVINHFKMSLRSQNGKPLSNICTADRDRERGQCRSCVYRYSGVVRMKGVVVWSEGKERDVCIGDVPTTMDNIRGN